MQSEYLMGFKGPGGGNEGSKHWNEYSMAEVEVSVLLSEGTSSRVRAASWRGVATVDERKIIHPAMMANIACVTEELERCTTRGLFRIKLSFRGVFFVPAWSGPTAVNQERFQEVGMICPCVGLGVPMRSAFSISDVANILDRRLPSGCDTGTGVPEILSPLRSSRH